MQKVLVILPFVACAQETRQELPNSSDVDCGYPGCAQQALPNRGALRQERVGCFTAIRGDRCFREVWWARNIGIRKHPEWYPNLTESSSLVDFQLLIHDRMPGKCPIPCGVPPRPKWCRWPRSRNIWPVAPGGGITIKALSYNLFWWNLYGVRRGDGDSAGNLIKAETVEDGLFDVMGFQECEDGRRVLEPVGLLDSYNVLQGPHAVCLAYRKGVWNLLARGSADVGEDMKSHYYGHRGVVWMRLVHNDTGRKLLFANHHGPLEVNSGGDCGGDSIANNLVEVMRNNSEQGDAVLLVGDFNANSASLTVQALWSRMVLLHSGGSFGGVDNIFGNMDAGDVVSRKNLGSGGSDHDAISVTVSLGPSISPLQVGGGLGGLEESNTTNETSPQPTVDAAIQATELLKANLPGDSWQTFWCGQLESDIGYVPVAGSWSFVINHQPDRGDDFDVAAPQRCCRLCQREPRCKSWTWKDGGPKRCEMFGSAPAEKEQVLGFVSGLPAVEAATEAVQAAARAITSMSMTSMP